MIITVPLSPGDVALAERQALACATGGHSQVREAADRKARLLEDQVVGQVGQLALHRWLFGSVERYVVGRYYQNKFPFEGDQGDDVPGCNLDVKTSRMRRSTDPWTYNLAVRPRERHEGWVYVLALVPQDFETAPRVHLVGWAADADLPAAPASQGPLAGAYVLPATELYRLPPIAYRWLP